MKTLFVLRHAKSSWDNPNAADFDRMLNQRGLEAAPLMGRAMRENRFTPDLILSSPARRASQTAQLVKEAAQFAADLKYEERIYEASPLTLFNIVADAPEDCRNLLLVGHNPGLEGLIKVLTGETCSMPTAALAEIILDIEKWSGLQPGCGRLENFLKPKALMEQDGER